MDTEEKEHVISRTRILHCASNTTSLAASDWANLQVQHFLKLLHHHQHDFVDDGGSANPDMSRGPGQKAQDPFQFVATRGGDQLADDARNVLSVAHQQKLQRDKILQSGRPVQPSKFIEHEAWQTNLDTWRKKRKDLLTNEQHVVESSSELTTRNENRPHASPQVEAVGRRINNSRKDRDEVLTISNENDHNNDSGIENRTTDSPSTSIDFSPRSTDLISPKSAETNSTHLNSYRSANLDQVLIPLKFSAGQKVHSAAAELVPEGYLPYLKKEPLMYEESTRIVETRPYAPVVASTKVEATFREPPVPAHRERVQPFVSQAAAHHEKSAEQIDMTVELNREQKATVTASKFPRAEPRSFSAERSKGHTLSHSISSPNVGAANGTTNLRTNSSTRIYHAVDIPFDESPAAYAPQKSWDDGIFAVSVEMGSHPVHKGIGMTTTRKDGEYRVESVIAGSPADRAGLLVGDAILSIDGHQTRQESSSRVAQLVRDAANSPRTRFSIQRTPVFRSTSSLAMHRQNSPSFDKARSLFVEPPSFDSYADFKRRHSRSRDSTSTRSSRDYNSLPRSPSLTNPFYERKRDASLSSYRTARDTFAGDSISLKSHTRDGDYRVTSLDDRRQPGKLTDFVPEVDRSPGPPPAPPRHTYDEPHAVRRYEFEEKEASFARHATDENASATLKRSSLHRNEPRRNENQTTTTEDVPVESRDWRDVINQQRQPTPGAAADRRAIDAASASIGNLPTYISRRLEESRSSGRELRTNEKYSPPPITETYERSEYNRYEKTNFPNTNVMTTHREKMTSIEKKEEHVVAVSGKHRCAHCNEELGRGAAMIVESLNLYFHLTCFRCYVCNTSLGSGTTGADVRVRDNRLHCQACYSSDRVHLSKV